MRSRLIWALIALALVAAPILFTLAREERFEAGVEITPLVPRSELGPDPLAYLESLARDEAVQDDALARAQLRGREDLLATASFRPVAGRRPGYALVVAGDTPERATALAGALAESMAGFSEASGEPRLAVEPRPAPPEPQRPADELVDALPGAFPPRPSPLWAGIAGLLVGLAVWLMSRLPRSRADGDPTPARG